MEQIYPPAVAIVGIGMCDSGEYWRQGKQLLNLGLRERCVLVEGYIPTCINTGSPLVC